MAFFINNDFFYILIWKFNYVSRFLLARRKLTNKVVIKISRKLEDIFIFYMKMEVAKFPVFFIKLS